MTKQLIEVQAEGYKPHLCSTEEQAQSIIQDMKARKPTSECSTKIWDLPYLCYDDAQPLAKDEDFIIITAGDIQLKFCIADFMSLSWSLYQAIEHADSDLVFVTSSLYCSVFSMTQAYELQGYIKSNYDMLKQQEDEYFIKYAKELEQVNSILASVKKKRTTH